MAHRLDAEQDLADTPEQIVKDRVVELMDAERFVRALRQMFAHRHNDKRSHDKLLEDAANAVSVAETVLSEWVEVNL